MMDYSYEERTEGEEKPQPVAPEEVLKTWQTRARQRREEVQKALYLLSERERNILILRFGIMDGKSKTLEEVGNICDISRETVRMIEAKALRKLRHPSRYHKLREFLE